MKIVKVIVEGGVVQHVEIPCDVKVIVRDYDIEGVESDLICQDQNGDSYIESVWESEPIVT